MSTRMRTLKSYLGPALAAAALTVSTLASAQSVLVLDPAGQGVRAAGAQVQPGVRQLRAEQRSLSIKDAQKLLASTEGPAWRVYEVRSAPTCTTAEQRKLARKGKKVEAKECSEQRQIFESAKKFAAKHGLSATSSSLYSLTTVLLTTKAAGAK